MVASSELRSTPADVFPPKDLCIQDRLAIFRDKFTISSPPEFDHTTGLMIFPTQEAGEWLYDTNPEFKLPFYDGQPRTFDEGFWRNLGTEQLKYQLPETGNTEVHARPIHLAVRNWDTLVRAAYLDDPGNFDTLPRAAELRVANGQTLDFVALGPDGRIFIEDVSCSINTETLYEKMKKVKEQYKKQIEKAYKKYFKEDIDPELIVARVIHFDIRSLPETNAIRVYNEDELTYYSDGYAYDEMVEYVA